MSKVQYSLSAYRDDHIGAIHRADTDNPCRTEADKLADRFGLGSFVKEDMRGTYMYEDGEVLTRFRLTSDS